MASPNIVNVLSIVGGTTPFVITATNTTASITATIAVINNAGSNSIVKLNTVMVTNTATLTLPTYFDLYRGGIGYPISWGINVPVGSTLVLLGKDTPIYLLEGDAVRMWSSTSSGLTAILSYETIG